MPLNPPALLASCNARSVRFALWLFALICLCTQGQAQYHAAHWSAEDGLPQNIVRGIAQTPDGYLWVATFDGLARFDGLHFTTFNRSNTPAIPTNRISTMYAAPNGDLWLLTEPGILLRVRGGVFTPYPLHVDAITGDALGHLWVLANEKIFEWQESKQSFNDVTPANVHGHMRALRWDGAGFWKADEGGIHCFVRGRVLHFPLPTGVRVKDLGVVAIDAHDSAWIETSDHRHTHQLANGTYAPLSPENELLTTSFVDANGHPWEIAVGFHLDRIIRFLSSGKPTEIPFTTIFQDREQNLWVAEEGQGLFCLLKQSIRSLSKEQGLMDRNIYPILEDRSGAIWIGSWIAGLSRLADGQIANFTMDDGLPSGLLTALAQDHDGRLWVGAHGGIRYLVNHRFQQPEGLEVPPAALAHAIYQDAAGVMWLGTSQGLYSYANGKTQSYPPSAGTSPLDIHVLIGSADGGLWIGGYGGLQHLQAGHLTLWTEREGLPSNNIRSLYQDKEGVLWIGTYDGGLGRLWQGRLTRYTEVEGLFNNGVFQILEDAHSNLWMSSNRGIYRVNKADLTAYAEGRRADIPSVAYGKNDGMLNVECNGGNSPAGIKARDGKLWFPTQDGVAIVDPSDVRQDIHAPRVVIESVVADRTQLPLSQEVRVPVRKQILAVQYTALSFIDSPQIRFKYKLEGFNSDWVDAGSRRTAYYDNLPPGHYLFHVIAANSDGVWNTQGATVSFAITAPFYRTYWFAGASLLCVVGLIAVAWHRHVARLRSLHALQHGFSQQLISSQEMERKRISADLHDSIGQRLIVINNLALFALRSMRQQADASSVTSMEEISAAAQSAIEETRSISYNLRPFQLDRLGLTMAIRSLLRSATHATDLTVSLHVDDIDDIFPEDTRVNVYRIVQEALTNVMKHAGATEVHVAIRRDANHVDICIRDNGQGLQQEPAVPGGFGIRNMTERASLLGGVLHIQAAAPHGTVILVTIPLPGKPL